MITFAVSVAMQLWPCPANSNRQKAPCTLFGVVGTFSGACLRRTTSKLELLFSRGISVDRSSSCRLSSIQSNIVRRPVWSVKLKFRIVFVVRVRDDKLGVWLTL